MSVRPFRLIPDSELRRLEETLAPIVSDWTKRWLDVGNAISLEVVDRAENLTFEGELWDFECSDDRHCVLRLVTAIRRKWVSLMLRSSQTLDVETDVTAALWSCSATELIERIAGATMGKEVVPTAMPARARSVSPRWCAPGSGIVRLGLGGTLGSFDILLPCATPSVASQPETEGHVDAQKRSALLQGALQRQHLAAKMILGSEEVEIGELLDLQIGDVIALNQRCDEPVTLRVDDADITIQGYLGQLGGAKAFVVMATNNRRGAHET